MSYQRLDDDVARAALEEVDWPGEPISVESVAYGVNDVFIVSTTRDAPDPVVVKFATFSRTDNFWAGIQAVRLLQLYTDLPVPEVYEFQPDPAEVPPFQIQEYCPGDNLEGPSETDNLAPVRVLGEVINELDSAPSARTEGYGTIQPPESPDIPLSDALSEEFVATGEHETCREWLLNYSSSHYEDPPDHDALASVAPEVPRYYEENASRFPTHPEQSIVLTDFGPANLLGPDGTLPEDGGVDDLTGILDHERAKLGPMEFVAVNAEYLMTRGMDNTDAVVDALYDPLPFGPDVPRRDLYWLVAMGRSVNALELWSDGDDHFQQRGTALARQIEQIV